MPYMLVYSALLLLGFLLAGHLVLMAVRQPLEKDGFYALFSRAVIGFLVSTTGYAMVVTSGNTVLWGLALVGALWLAMRRRAAVEAVPLESGTEERPPALLQPLLIFMGMLVGFVVLHSLLHFHTPLNNIQHFDDVYYAWLTSKMELFGVESDDPLFAGPHSFPAMPYHYADLWMAGLISTLFPVSKLIAYSVIAKSLIYAMAIFGFLALARTFTRSAIVQMLSLSALLVAPVLLDYSHVLENGCNLGQPKNALTSLFFIWMLYLHQKQSAVWFIPLLVLPVINIAFAPIVLPTLLALAAYQWFRRKNGKGSVIMAGCTLAITALVFCFYTLQPKLVEDPFSVYEDLLIFYDLTYLADMTYRIVANYAMYVPYLIPVMLFAVWKLRKGASCELTALLLRHETIMAYTAISIVIGWAMAFLFWPVAGENASQMNTNSNFMLVGLLVVVALLATYQELRDRRHRMMLTLFMGVVFTYSVAVYAESRGNFLFNPASQRSVTYINEVTGHFGQTEANVLGGIFRCEGEFHQQGKSGSRSELMNGYWFTPFVSGIDFLYATSLNTLTSTYEDFDPQTLDFSLEEDRRYYWWIKKTEKTLRRAAFTHFHRQYAEENPGANMEASQLAFAKAQGLGFVVTSGNCPLPEVFIPAVDTLFIDDMTGEHFYFLQKPNQ